VLLTPLSGVSEKNLALPVFEASIVLMPKPDDTPIYFMNSDVKMFDKIKKVSLLSTCKVEFLSGRKCWFSF
jgi:hypothetical protein